MTLQIGAHVERDDPVAGALERGGTVAQFFLGDPQSWKKPVLAYPDGPESLRAAAAEAGVKLFVHAPYALNVATTNNRIRIPGRKLLQQTIDLAAECGVSGVIVHGGHLNAGEDPEAGFENWFKAIDRTDLKVPLLIENTAGGDNAMARRLERIDRLWTVIAPAAQSDNVGFCLDTCHAHAGGEELAGLVDRVRAITGRIDLVHLNDSRDAFDSGADRHANLGAGHCDPDGLMEAVREAGAPVVVETPGGADEQAADIAWVRERLG